MSQTGAVTHKIKKLAVFQHFISQDCVTRQITPKEESIEYDVTYFILPSPCQFLILCCMQENSWLAQRLICCQLLWRCLRVGVRVG